MMGIAVSLMCGMALERGAMMPAPESAPMAGSPLAAETAPVSPIEAAIARIARESSHPARAERALRARLASSHMCYAVDMTADQLEELMRHTLLRPPGRLEYLDQNPQDRFFVDFNTSNPNANLVWVGEGQLGPRGTGNRANLTYSFPNDGVTWGDTDSGFGTAPNELGARLTTLFGASDLDEGREYFRQSLAAWRKLGGLTYTEVADDSIPMSEDPTRSSARGDFRIGGIPLGQNGILAYNGFPSIAGIGQIGGGDMCFNTSYFTGTNHFSSTGNDYRYLRNTAIHEHGHGLGYIHSVPCTLTKIMEPQISTTILGLTTDEKRGIVFNYGDRYSGNHSFLTSADLGNLTSPVLRSDIQRDLGVNPVGTANNSDEDFFRFTLSSAQTVTINVDPTGGSYTNDRQSSGCSGVSGTPAPTINADQAGNLSVYLLNAGETVVASAVAGAAGVTETIVQALAAGAYTIRIVNDGNANGAETDPNRLVQLYDLEVRIGSAKAPPWAIAGVNKRIAAGQLCYFNAFPNTQVTESGATISSPGGYAWDLDGNGSFESGGTKPSITYVSNGTYTVTLRVTDSNAMQDTDTISVQVFGATGVIDEVSPSTGVRGNAVPVEILGTNFKGVTNANQILVSGGAGVTVSGTPVVDALGTSITGISFVLSGSAALGSRTVQILDSDGLGNNIVLANAFTVTAAGVPSNDECVSPTSWGNTTGAKTMVNAGATNSASQSFPSTGCPSGGPINNDVWYTWTCPTTGTLTVTNNSLANGFDSRIALYANNCPASGGTLLGCDDFGASITTNVTAGTTYLFRCGSVNSGQTGSATVTLSIAVPSGACCSGTTCVVQTQAACAGVYQGNGVPCGSFANPTTCCPANLDLVGGVTVTDLFAFLDAWFLQNGSSGANLSADFNRDSTVDVVDLFAYLDAWFLGC